MPLTAALLAIGALLVGTALVGLALRRRTGRSRDGGTLRLQFGDLNSDRGERATLVQFSSEMCARCPQVSRMLRAHALGHEGVAHAEVDLTHRPDLASRYRVLQTPTTFLVDPTGIVLARFHGVPQQQALTDALATV